MEKIAVLVARLIFAGVFAMAAWFKFAGMAATAGYIASAELLRVDAGVLQLPADQGVPARVVLGPQLLDRDVRAVVLVELGQARLDLHRQAELGRERLGGLQRPGRRAAVDGVDGVVRQGLDDAHRLLPAEVGEPGVRGTAVVGAVDPHGQRVTHEDQLHAGRA